MRFFGCRDPVLVGRPGAKIDTLAACRAKRTVATFCRPFDLRAAFRAGNQARRSGPHRLHKVSSKLTVESTWRGL